jgi:membrane-bound lytic murein transglycosylase D
MSDLLQKMLIIALSVNLTLFSDLKTAKAAIPPKGSSLREKLQAKVERAPSSQKASLIFDLPLTYNQRVSYWVKFFQTRGKNWFDQWLEKSTRYMPFIQKELKAAGLPQDLAFMVMIESGFDANAYSSAHAVGPWQFIRGTGERYGLRSNWWLDERRDLLKSTRAATRYLRDLYREFGSWYLVAASYNMGENGLRRKIRKHQTRDFWELARLGALPKETTDYVPKILAAMLIAKSPALYGFSQFAKLDALEFDSIVVPAGTDLGDLADHLGVTRKSLRDLNSELLLGYVPRQAPAHNLRVPKGSLHLVAEFVTREQQIAGWQNRPQQARN